MLKTRSNSPSHRVPYIVEFERLALNVLKEGANNKMEIRELLEKYADRYAREHSSKS